MLVQGRGRRAGSIHPDLDPEIESAALKALEDRRSALVAFQLEDRRWLPVRAQRGGLDVYLEVLARPPHLIVVGAGHIAAPLAQIASLLDFRVTVLDDRAEYATKERFPTADELLVGSYAPTLSSLPMGRDTFVVLVTRGHVHDQACLRLVLDREVTYIGMIGSRRRVRTVMEQLAAAGHDPRRLERVFAPVGLDIGAQSPAEIAVAILAEIVNIRRGGRAPSLALGERLRV
jgi:xanthine dehydrogenase accessory factor